MKQQNVPARARTWLRRCMAASMLGCLPLLAPAAHAEKQPEGADDCVQFENRVGDKQVRVHVQNGCAVKLSCQLKYTLRCSATDGTETSRETKTESFKLERKGSRELVLSAESCRQSWDIDQMTWTCA